MRIGIDYTSAVCQGAGIGRYTRELVNALLACDPADEFRLFAAASAGRRGKGEPLLVPAAINAGLRLLPISDRRMATIWHRLRLPIPVELFTGQVDVFHSPDFTLPPVWRARTLLTIHDLSFVTHPETVHPLVLRYLNAAVPRSVRRADHVIAVSEHTRRDLVHWLGIGEEHVSVIYHGVNPAFRRVADGERLAAVRARYGLPERFILHVGTLQPRKNLPRLIEAYAALIGAGDGLGWPPPRPSPARQGRVGAGATGELPVLVLAGGKGWLEDEIYASVKHLGLEGYVRFLGFVDDADLPALYSLAELFVFPTLYEGFGLPVLEAMACGTPVVCSDASSLPEVTGEAALLVAPTDVSGLTAAMRRALTDADLRARLFAAGLARARQFTWEDAARRTVALYRGSEGVKRCLTKMGGRPFTCTCLHASRAPNIRQKATGT
jgi:glycosyltransferase involved in cell wall biosynthesis